VHIGHHLLPERGFTLLRYVVLGIAKEELLVAGEIVLQGSGFACEGSAVSIVGGGEADEIGDVFRKRLLAVESKVRKRSVGVLLGGKSGRRWLVFVFGPALKVEDWYVRSGETPHLCL
jgi:hypothetical protein